MTYDVGIEGTGMIETKFVPEQKKFLDQRPIVSIVAPVYNEEQVIAEFIRRLTAAVSILESKYVFEFVLVNDGSRDRSLQIAKEQIAHEPRLRVVELRKNYGQTGALQAGLDMAQGDIIISMDADLQHFPEEIPMFLEKLEEGYDVVCGWRSKRQEGVIRRWPSRVANAMIRNITKLKVHDIGTTFRAYRKEIVKDIQLYGENHRFVPVFAQWVGAKITEVPIQNIERPAGKSNYGISRSVKVFLDLFFLYFLVHYFDRPIRFFGSLSLILFTVATGIGAVLLGLTAFTGVSMIRQHFGWFILTIFLALTAIQLLLTGIISEVLTRVYFKAGATTYHVRKEWNNASLT